jgi:hypothetical protein
MIKGTPEGVSAEEAFPVSQSTRKNCESPSAGGRMKGIPGLFKPKRSGQKRNYSSRCFVSISKNLILLVPPDSESTIPLPAQMGFHHGSPNRNILNPGKDTRGNADLSSILPATGMINSVAASLSTP